MWEKDDQQYAVAFVVFSSVGGSVLGPLVGGFVQQYLAWQWTIWIQVCLVLRLLPQSTFSCASIIPDC